MVASHDYNAWTKEGLIREVQSLERELRLYRQQQQDEASGPQQKPEAGSLAPQPPLPPAPPPKSRKRFRPNPSRYSTRFVALKLSYLGKNYNGFEYQNSGALTTVEEELWKALVKTCLIFPENPDVVDFGICEYSKCGRTDRGVSAFGQVVALRVRSNRPVPGRDRERRSRSDESAAEGQQEVDGGDAGAAAVSTVNEADGQRKVDEEGEDAPEIVDASVDVADDAPYPVEDEIKYCRVLNHVLPKDIRILAWCPEPPPGFSARFSCRERQYRYFFTQPAYSPMPARLESGRDGVGASSFKDGYLDIEAMRTAAAHFEGLHDFRNFCKIDASKQITNFSRHVFQSEIVELPGLESSMPYLGQPEFLPAGGVEAAVPKVYYFHVRGSAFLWHQIRHMMAVLFLVGQGLEQPSIVPELLDVDRFPSSPSYHMAWHTPLVLWDCLFGAEGERPAGAAEEVGADALAWVYPGEAGDSLDLHGTRGLVEALWQGWSGAKMDELLANRLLDRVTELTSRPDRAVLQADAAATTAAQSQRVYVGGDKAKLIGSYVSLAKRPLGLSFEQVNDKWARRNGFSSADVMRSTENWRSAIKEARRKGKRDDKEGDDMEGSLE